MRILVPSSLRRRWISPTLSQHVRLASTASLVAGSKELRPLSKQKPARTRFAPSPTGFLHLGSLRTALFNYLVAKATHGQFILRIEDTDQKRTIPGAIDRLYEDLKWAGLNWDEGPDVQGPYGPYQQSQRLSLYKNVTEELLNSRSAYRCFCSPYRLASLANHQSKLGLPLEYDRTCASILRTDSDARAASGEAHVIRLMVPDKNAYPPFNDLVYGVVQQKKKFQAVGSYEDPILLKSDGFPTYHLANVVDDHLMQITHVIRGAEWMVSTHKHMMIYQALDWEPPIFAHVGLLLDKEGQKLSKRAGSVDVSSFRAQGIFPETLTNFLALLGWSHNQANDVMSLEDLINNASLKYTRGDSIVSPEKLNFLQRRHARRYASSPCSENPLHTLHHLAVIPIVKELESRVDEENFSTFTKLPPGEARESYVKRIVEADANNYVNPQNFVSRNIYFFVSPSPSTLRKNMPKVFELNTTSPGTIQSNIEQLLVIFRIIQEIELDEWSIEKLRNTLNSIVELMTNLSQEDQTSVATEESGPLAKCAAVSKSWSKFVHEYLRWALCAGKPGPDGISILLLLGKATVSERLLRAEKLVRQVRQEGQASSAALP
ncbi:hypothetical protein K3495_g2464 [Podosphaera aphanis]|nr:hypothetical protein K3495_g2464 [Podosphaera aphanis]